MTQRTILLLLEIGLLVIIVFSTEAKKNIWLSPYILSVAIWAGYALVNLEWNESSGPILHHNLIEPDLREPPAMVLNDRSIVEDVLEAEGGFRSVSAEDLVTDVQAERTVRNLYKSLDD